MRKKLPKRIFRRYYLTLIWCVLMVVVIMIAGTLSYIRWHEEPKIHAARVIQDRFLTEFLADRGSLENESWLHVSKTGSKDAGAIINSHLLWYPINDHVTYQALPIDRSWRQQVTAEGDQWMPLYYKFNRLTIDFSLLKALSQADYWDIEDNSPIAEQIQKHNFVNSFERPMPNLNDLTILAKLYAMRGTDDDNALEILKNLHHIGELLLTTEHLETELAALTFFRIEAQAYNYYAKEDIIGAQEWTLPDATVFEKVQRVYLASRGYLHLWTESDVLNKVFNGKETLAVCSAINEGIPNDWLLRPLLSPEVWLEPDFSTNYKSLQNVVQKSKAHCRLKYVSALMQSGHLGHLPIPMVFAQLPYSRKLFGIQISRLGFTGFEGYSLTAQSSRSPVSTN